MAQVAKWNWPIAIATIYLIGAALMLFRFLAALFMTRHLVRESEQISLAPTQVAIVGHTAVRCSRRLRVPVTAGLLPASDSIARRLG